MKCKHLRTGRRQPGWNSSPVESRRRPLVGIVAAGAFVLLGLVGCNATPQGESCEPVAVYPTEWPPAIEGFRAELNPLEPPFDDMRRSYCLMIWAGLGLDADLMRGLLAERIFDMDEGSWLEREEFLADLESRQALGLSEQKRAILFWDRISGTKLGFFNVDDVRRLNVAGPPGMAEGDYLLIAAPAESAPQYFFFREVRGCRLIYAVGQGVPKHGGDSGTPSVAP